MAARTRAISRSHSPRNRGASLLECLAAGTILATAILAGLEVVATQSMVHASSSQSSKALQLLKHEMEHAILETFNDLENSEWEGHVDHPEFEIRWQVQSEDTETKVVTVQVRYDTPNGHQRVDELTTLRCSGSQASTVVGGGGVKGMQQLGVEGAEL